MKQLYFEEELSEGKGMLDVTVEIGSVTIQPHDGRTVTVDAEIRHMVVSVTRKGNTVYVRTETDDGAVAERIGRLFNRNHPKARLTIHIPPDCEVKAKTITGKLTVEGIKAPVTARVITGDTSLVNISGPIYAKTITGKLQYKGALTDDNHRFETTTGTVQLCLPKEPNARLDARITTGNIQCEFPLTQKQASRHFIGRKLSGVLGAGTGRIKAKVVTGNLQLEHA